MFNPQTNRRTNHSGNHDYGLDNQHAAYLPEAVTLFTSAHARSVGIHYLDRVSETVAEIRSPSAPPGSPNSRLVVYGNPTQPEFLGKPYSFIYPPYPSPQSVAAWTTVPKTGPGLDQGLDTYNTANTVSIWVTHSPPRGRRDAIPLPPLTGCEVLARAIARARPALSVFGHYHSDHGAELVQWKPRKPDEDIYADGGIGETWEEKIESASVLVDNGEPALIDLSSDFKPGLQTLFVNAAWMTLEKKQVEKRNKPIVVKLPISALH